jgi:NDP-sugar pyrophosphorylase family protein
VSLPSVCILAGGLGSRLGDRVATTPKPLLEVAGEPFLVHQLRLLAANDCDHVVLCVGYLGELVEARIGRQCQGIVIEYSYDGPGLDGTLGAIRRALPLLPERFLVLYGDTYLRLDYRAAAENWERSGRLALMTVLRNGGQWDRSNACFDEELVVTYDKVAPGPELEWIDYGLGGLKRDALSFATPDESDLAGLYGSLAAAGELCGYEVFERFYEIGSPTSLVETDAFLRAL